MGDSSGGPIHPKISQLNYSIDGAQSINLQNFLKSNAPFVCEQCNRFFETYRDLQIHRGHHNKLTEKMLKNLKENERKVKKIFFSVTNPINVIYQLTI